jgi:hypothetical protein
MSNKDKPIFSRVNDYGDVQDPNKDSLREEPVLTNLTKFDLDLLRVLGRYAEAYFGKTVKELPKALNDVKALLTSHIEEAERKALEVSRDDVDIAIRWGKPLSDVLAKMNKRIKQLKQSKGEQE